MTGVTGQDGAYLAGFILQKGYYSVALNAGTLYLRWGVSMA